MKKITYFQLLALKDRLELIHHNTEDDETSLELEGIVGELEDILDKEGPYE